MEVYTQPWQILHALQAQTALRDLSVPLAVNAPIQMSVVISWTRASIWHFSTLLLFQEVLRNPLALVGFMQIARQLKMDFYLLFITPGKIACQPSMEQTLRTFSIRLHKLEWSPLRLTHQVMSSMCVPFKLVCKLKLKLFRLWSLLSLLLPPWCISLDRLSFWILSL